MDIDDAIASAIEVAGYSIHSSDVELSVQIEPGLPPIWADPDQLSQVLINLLVNAEQALHDWEGQRKITVQAMRLAANGNVVVKITDSGPGISKEIQSRIFDPFFTTKEVGSGTGIGLSFCHRIVQSHGGTIEVESEEGKGSIFVISLPASGRAETASEVVKAELPRSPGLCCLVVDDEREVSAIIGEVLACDGFSVTIANSGEQALAQLGKQEFGLILCDLKMPNMDGRRLFNTIAELHPAMIDRLEFLTGDTVSPDAQAFLRATGRPYIEKPIKPYELRSFVSRLINKDA
jgi:CheY-like chemotaxis protein/anti-sigma regulatory factor (Ser/Thr protein kinase)